MNRTEDGLIMGRRLTSDHLVWPQRHRQQSDLWCSHTHMRTHTHTHTHSLYIIFIIQPRPGGFRNSSSIVWQNCRNTNILKQLNHRPASVFTSWITTTTKRTHSNSDTELSHNVWNLKLLHLQKHQVYIDSVNGTSGSRKHRQVVWTLVTTPSHRHFYWFFYAHKKVI